MAVCSWCFAEMMTAQSCTVDAMHRQGVPVPMIPCGREFGWPPATMRCGDCGVARGGWHHPGCDMQQCAVCGEQMLSCDCRFDEDGPDDDDEDFDLAAESLPFGVDGNGALTELMSIGGNDVIVHHDDVPLSDITEVNGIRCTTALRTVIDLAIEMAPDHLDRALRDCLARGLFTVAEAHQRLGQPDMNNRAGAQLLRSALDRID